MNSCGIKQLYFSNSDEWMWQSDPVMVSIADELFKAGHHMIMISVPNNGELQKGASGGFMQDIGTHRVMLVESTEMPEDALNSGIVPDSLNTTFYALDIEWLANNPMPVDVLRRLLVVKKFPRGAGVDKLFGVDGFAGSAFAKWLNPALISWPKLNFAGTKDLGFIVGMDRPPMLGGRSWMEFMAESVSVYPVIMEGLVHQKKEVGEFLFNNGYSYLRPTVN